jgi:outer membrane protein TolC
MPATGVPAELVTRRPDLRAAYARLAAADEGVAAAIADRFPSIGLSARVEGNAEEVGDVFDNWLASVAGNLVGPILDGGRRAAEVERVRAVSSERFHGYGAAVLGALGEVEDALVREEMQREYEDSLGKQIELSRKVVEQSRLRYLQGATDYLPVLESLATLQRLERTGIEARGTLVEYRIGLYRALGGGWALERTNERNTDSGEVEQ